MCALLISIYIIIKVVAGTNYKLTISIHHTKHPSHPTTESCLQSDNDNTVILGGIRHITVYKPLPYMKQPLKITSWGTVLQCNSDPLLKLLNRRDNIIG